MGGGERRERKQDKIREAQPVSFPLKYLPRSQLPISNFSFWVGWVHSNVERIGDEDGESEGLIYL